MIYVAAANELGLRAHYLAVAISPRQQARHEARRGVLGSSFVQRHAVYALTLEGLDGLVWLHDTLGSCRVCSVVDVLQIWRQGSCRAHLRFHPSFAL